MKKMKINSKIKNRKVLLALIIFIVGLLLLFVCRGWVRMNAIPATVKAVQGDAVKKVYDSEIEKLQNPLVLLGYTYPGNISSGCVTSLANGVKTQVYCHYGILTHNYEDRATPSNDELTANAEKFQNLLGQGGWKNVGPSASLIKIVSDVTGGTNTHGDIAYEKTVGHIMCRLHANSFFSDPNSPLLNVEIYCFRGYNILGTPSWT